MNQNIGKLSILACVVLGTSTAFAASPVELSAKSMSFVQGHFKIAPHALSDNKHSLKELSNSRDFNQTYHQRMQQIYQGVPVIGGYAIIHSKKANGFSAGKAQDITGTLYKDIAADLGEKPANNSQKALKLLENQFKNKVISDKQAELVVFVDNQDKAHWAYKVSFLAEDGQSIPKKPIAYIDAKSFKKLLEWNDIKTLENHSAYGTGLGGNDRVGDYTYSNENGTYPLLEITRNDEKQECYMENDLVKIMDMSTRDGNRGRAMSFPCEAEYSENVYWTGSNQDGKDEVNGARSPSNDALYIGYVIHHMYKEWYGVDALKNRDGSTMQLVMRVHYGNNYQNAFWDGRQMTYGDGGSMMYPLVSMGVGAHEISHGFTQQHSNLQYYGQSGGMNESFSDMAAMGAIFYSEGEKDAPSFKIGDRIMKASSGYDALRFMDKPSRDGRSIDSANDYYDGLDVHYSSGVFNRMFYLMATADGWNTHMAFDVMVKANSDYWGAYEKFQSGACGVLKATRDFGYPMSDVEKAVKEVGVDPERCFS